MYAHAYACIHNRLNNAIAQDSPSTSSRSRLLGVTKLAFARIVWENNYSTENDALTQPAFRVAFATDRSELAADPVCVAESKLAERAPIKIRIGLLSKLRAI